MKTEAEMKIKKREFFVHQLVTTGICSLERLQGVAEFKVYIGKPVSDPDSQDRPRIRSSGLSLRP